MIRRARQLVGRLASLEQGRPVNMRDYNAYYTFDNISDLALGGGDFSLIESGDKYRSVSLRGLPFRGLLTLEWNARRVVEAMDSVFEVTGLLRQAVWLRDIFEWTGANGSDSLASFRAYSKREYQRRLKQGSKSNLRDIFQSVASPRPASSFDLMRIDDRYRSYFLGEDKEAGTTKMTPGQLASDSAAVIGAGFHTSSVTMTMLLFQLLNQPAILARLRSDLDRHFVLEHRPFEVAELNAVPLLTACVNEVLRVWPVVCLGIIRQVPAGGATIEGRHFPAGTSIRLPQFPVHRDPRNFSPHPDRFRPDRWLYPEKEEAFDKRAWVPFSTGPANCIVSSPFPSLLRASKTDLGS